MGKGIGEGGTNPTGKGKGRAKGDRCEGRGGLEGKGKDKQFQDVERTDQRRLLLAWASLEESALDDSACKDERNDITHLLERKPRSFNLEDGLATKDKFANFKSEFCKWKNEAELDTDLVHALAFIRLLGHVREVLYNHEEDLCESVGGEMRHGRRLNEGLAQHKIDINKLIVELKGFGLDIMKFKRINRLRNAFVKQTAPLLSISAASAKKIAKELNDLCIGEEDDFVHELLQRLKNKLGKNDNFTPDKMLEQLRQDDFAESGKRLEELDVNAMQLLHAMHKAWFTLRGPPRNIGLEDIKGNALKAAHACNGAFLDIHKAIADACPESGLAEIASLPDIGTVIEESLSTLREAGMNK